MFEKNIKDVDFVNVKLQDCLKGELQILPLRTLDEFILSSAKFQLPHYKDPQRWWNRVYNNLFYYQTNYFFTAIVIFIYFLLVYTTKLVYGMVLTFNIIKFLVWFINKSSSRPSFKVQELVLSCIGIFLLRFLGFNVSYAFNSLMLFWISIFAVIFVTLVHSSLRLRNLSNKVVNFLEGEKRTPMTIIIFTTINFLGALGKWMVTKTSRSNKGFILRNYYEKR